MQYFEKTFTTKVNLDIPINGINQDCLKFIPKTKNRKKQKIAVGDVKGYVYLVKNEKKQWCSDIWHKVDENLPQEERSIKSLQICKILKSKKNKRDRILYSDGKYIKCVNKKNLLQSDNLNVDKQFGSFKKVFGDDNHLIFHTQENNSLQKIQFKKKTSWLSLGFDLKLQVLQQKPYINQINDLDYDYDNKTIVFTSLNCAFITDTDLNAITGIGHTTDVGRIKVFDLRKERFNAFSIQPQQNNQGNRNFFPLIPTTSVLLESKNTNELIIGTYFKNQYAQVDQVLQIVEKQTCFGYGDIFKSEKNQIICGYKGGFQLFQEDLNRVFQPIEQVTQNMFLPNIPISCESGDFKEDIIHQNLGEFLLYSQDGQITSISPQLEQNQKQNNYDPQQFGFRLGQDETSKFNQEMQKLNPLVQNDLQQQMNQQTSQNEQRQTRSKSSQPTSASQLQNSTNQNLNSSFQDHSTSQQDQKILNEVKQNTTQKNEQNLSQFPPKPKKRHKLDFQINRASNQNEQENSDEQKNQKSFDASNQNDESAKIEESKSKQQQEDDKKIEQDSYQYFLSQLQPKKKSKIVDDEMEEIEKQFQAALNKTSQPFIVSKISNSSSSNGNYNESKNSKLGSIVFSNNISNKNLSFKQSTIRNGIMSDQRQELVGKFMQNTQNSKFYDAQDILKITEKQSPKKEQKQNDSQSPIKQYSIMKDVKNDKDQQQLNEQSPTKIDSSRGRMRRPSFNKQRDHSLNFSDLSQNIINDFPNLPSFNLSDLSQKQDSQSSKIDSNGQIQSPEKSKPTFEYQKSNQKSSIMQNVEKELQKNQINLNYTNPLDFLKKNSNEMPSTFNQQKQQKARDEQDQRIQQQMVQKRRRISSDFYNLSQDQSDQIINQGNQQESQQNYDKKDEQNQILPQHQFDKTYPNKASPQRFSRQSSIDNFYNQERQEERPKILINNNRNNNDLSIYTKLEEFQNSDLNHQKFSLNKDFSKEDLKSNYGLSFQQSSEDLSTKQDNVKHNNLFPQNPIKNNQQINNFSKKKLNLRKDSFDFYEEENNNIPNQNKQNDKSLDFFNQNNNDDDNNRMSKQENQQESKNQNYIENNFIDNNFSLVQIQKQDNQNNKYNSQKLSLKIDDKEEFSDYIIEDKKNNQILNSKDNTQLKDVSQINNHASQQLVQNKQQNIKDNQRSSIQQNPYINQKQNNINQSNNRNQNFNQPQRRSIQSINTNIKKNPQNQQVNKKKFLLDSPTKLDDEDQFIQDCEKICHQNMLWRKQIPSRSFLSFYENDQSKILKLQRVDKSYIHDSDEIFQIEILPTGYDLEYVQSNHKIKNSSFKIIKKYNSKFIQFFNNQNNYLVDDNTTHHTQTQQKQNKSANILNQIYENDDSTEITIENLRKEVQEIQNQLIEISQFFKEQKNEKVKLQPTVNYTKDVLLTQNRVRYNIQTQYQIETIHVAIKTYRSVEIKQPINIDIDKEDKVESVVPTDSFRLIQINKCQGSNEETKQQSYEINIIDKEIKSICFDMQYNEDGFTVETVFYVKFKNFENSFYELVDKNKAFQFLKLEKISKQNLIESPQSNYHSLKLDGLQKKQLFSILHSLFNFQINENDLKNEEFFIKTLNQVFNLNIILHCKQTDIIFYSQSLQYIKCLQNRISSRIDESVYKIQFSINISQNAYIYHFDQIFSKAKFRKDIREQQSVLIPLQEIVQSQGTKGLSKQYKKLLYKQDELNQNFLSSYDFDEICRMQLDNIVRCYISVNPSQKTTFERQKHVIDNLIFNLRVKQIYSLLFPLENHSFISN